MLENCCSKAGDKRRYKGGAGTESEDDDDELASSSFGRVVIQIVVSYVDNTQECVRGEISEKILGGPSALGNGRI